MSGVDVSDPAFPFQPIGPQGLPNHQGFPGLTKRELIASMAMQGLLASFGAHRGTTKECARLGLQAADCLIAELAKDGAA